MKIRTEFVYPPIPDRSHDWSAVDDNTYDGAEGSNCPIGWGATKEMAIIDLLDQCCKDHGADVGAMGQCLYCAAEAGEQCKKEILND